jgi:hypothetical protein
MTWWLGRQDSNLGIPKVYLFELSNEFATILGESTARDVAQELRTSNIGAAYQVQFRHLQAAGADHSMIRWSENEP